MPRAAAHLLTSLVIFAALIASTAHADDYLKAVEGPDVVLGKLFPKKGKVELDAKFGVVLNSSYQQSFLANGGLTYYFSEEWGFNVEGNFGVVTDKSERKCVESFYNDPNFAVGDECDGSDEGASKWKEDPEGDANYGPAYVPVRTIKMIFTGNMVWNPIYGKQIVLLSATNYFDFYILMGGGVAITEFQPKTKQFEDGRDTRGTFCVKKDFQANKCSKEVFDKNPGTTDPELVGINGRPLAQSQTNVLGHVGIGQRFHFFKRFLFTASLEDYLLLGTDAGFDNFLTIMGGLGVRF